MKPLLLSGIFLCRGFQEPDAQNFMHQVGANPGHTWTMRDPLQEPKTFSSFYNWFYQQQDVVFCHQFYNVNSSNSLFFVFIILF